MTTTTRVPRWQLRDDAEQLGRMLARSGVPRQSCVLKDPDIQAALLRGWQSEIAAMGVELDHIDAAETELDQTTPQPWRYDLMFWLAAVAVVAVCVACIYVRLNF